MMTGPDPSTQFILDTCSMGFMTGDEAGQGKRLTLFIAWDCVVIYVLCDHAGKCQVRYFARNDYHLCMPESRKDEQ